MAIIGMPPWHENRNTEASQQSSSLQRRGFKPSKSSRSVEMAGDVHETRRVRDSVPLRLWAVAGIGFFERAAFWGLTAPWQNYMEIGYSTQHDTNQTPGALGLGQVKATRIYCAFYIFYYVAPLAIAPVADCHLGQYTTLVISLVLYCFGCTVLTVSSLPSNLVKGWGLPGLIIAMVLIGLGGGGFRAIMVPFIADQYTETKPRLQRSKSGEQTVTDYSLTLQYIYNLYFWVGNLGSLSWFATVYIEKRYGFAGAYGLTLGFIFIALSILLCGKRWYVKSIHKDDVLPQATRIIACAVREGFNMNCTEPEYQRTHRRKTVSWNTHFVNELTRALQACRVLLAFVFFYLCFDQMQNNLISQAGQMETDKTPNDMLPAMNQVGCIVLGPLIQEVLYPTLQKRRVYIKPITRITIGFIFITFSMLYATIVQQAIYSSPPCYNHPSQCGKDQWISKWGLKSNRPNVWIQAPLYFLIATGEIFAVVTGLEYAYANSPKDMKVFVQAISLLIGGIGSACAMAIAEVARDPNLVWFYTSLTGGMAATTLVFWLVFRHYDKTHPSDDENGTFQDAACDMEKQKTKVNNQVAKPSATLSTAAFVVPAHLAAAAVDLARTMYTRPRTAHSEPMPLKRSENDEVSKAPLAQPPKNLRPTQSLGAVHVKQPSKFASLDVSTLRLPKTSSLKELTTSTRRTEQAGERINEPMVSPPAPSKEQQHTARDIPPAIPPSVEHPTVQAKEREERNEVITWEPAQSLALTKANEESNEAFSTPMVSRSPTPEEPLPTTSRSPPHETDNTLALKAPATQIASPSPSPATPPSITLEPPSTTSEPPSPPFVQHRRGSSRPVDDTVPSLVVLYEAMQSPSQSRKNSR